MTETKNGWGGDEGSMYKVHMYIRVTGRAVTSLGTLFRSYVQNVNSYGYVVIIM